MNTDETVYTLRLTRQQIIEAHIGLLTHGNALRGDNCMHYAREVWAVADEIRAQLPECFGHLDDHEL